MAKATFYSHFPSKDDLVVGRQSQHCRNRLRGMIAAILGRISEAAVEGSYRGCPFLNAAAEYPDPASPVRQAIDARREWYHGVLRDLLAADGDPTPSVTASLLVALSDGLLEIAYLDDAKHIPSLVREALARLLVRR